ncbi:hypothetical protein RBB79_17265 [Tunturiibacter empetritectus]|uniref:Uncharacterized protein n=1 Tax=Tunturiibacter lichenicola TaxID=2051959 RepID=A0A852VP52_9BACT|nr:hypothetical protein [Edaphobacter lichenicola]NYF91376.1 hypothetical protein [Edaphobacter lichenicola]
MRIDIPQEPPRRRDGDERVAPQPGEWSVSRKVPNNPIRHRLKSLEVKDEDSRRTCPREKRPRDKGARDVPRDRRRPEPSADPRRPSRTASNIVGLELRPEEKQLLSEAGRFRVVRVADLRETLYNGKSRPLENDLRYLRDKGLVETSQVNLRRDGRRRTIERVEVATLTQDGRRLLLKQGDLPKDQRLYAGLVKPREVEHDSQIYRAYRKEVQKITEKGGSNLRVKLDFEIKSQVQKAIHAERKADPKRDMAEIKHEVAERLELPFVDGKIQIPDARIEYDLPRDMEQTVDADDRSRTGHEDIEVLTAAYHAGHLRSKGHAGFRNYASAADRATIISKIEDEHYPLGDILEL